MYIEWLRFSLSSKFNKLGNLVPERSLPIDGVWNRGELICVSKGDRAPELIPPSTPRVFLLGN